MIGVAAPPILAAASIWWRGESLLKNPRSHFFSFDCVEATIFVCVKLYAHFFTPDRLLLAAMFNGALSLGSFGVVNRAVAISIETLKGGSGIMMVLSSTSCVVRVHTLAQVVPLFGREQVDEVLKVLLASFSPLGNESGLALHECAKGAAIWRI